PPCHPRRPPSHPRTPPARQPRPAPPAPPPPPPPPPPGKIPCPRRPESMTLPRDRPEITAPPGHPPPCCAQQTITVPPGIAAKTRQKHDYPPAAWRRSDQRPTPAERANATIQDPPTSTNAPRSPPPP